MGWLAAWLGRRYKIRFYRPPSSPGRSRVRIASCPLAFVTVVALGTRSCVTIVFGCCSCNNICTLNCSVFFFLLSVVRNGLHYFGRDIGIKCPTFLKRQTNHDVYSLSSNQTTKANVTSFNLYLHLRFLFFLSDQ